jgi:small subunit ribosomal protein S8e
MVISQARSLRKNTGGRYQKFRNKKQFETGSLPALPKPGKTQLKIIRGTSGNKKFRLLHAEFANVIDPKTKKAMKLKIDHVTDNAANRYYVRRNILTKGAIIQTEKGKAKITSRPGQDGTINAVLVTEK